MKIYLSPSNQINNRYQGQPTNEAAQMERVYRKTVELLQKYECTVLPTTLSKSPFYYANSRVDEAIAMKADLYLAMHSNATAKPPSSLAGAIIFYRPDNGGMRDKLARNLQRSINAAHPSNLPINATGLRDGFTPPDDYGEVTYPHRGGIPGFLIEYTFHDNPVAAEWVVKTGTDALAVATVKAIVETYGLKAKGSPAPAPSGKTYVVQSGDSPWEIAVSQLGDGFRWKEIMALNGLAENAYIHPGQTLKIPDDGKPEPTPAPKDKQVKLKAGTPIFPAFTKDKVAEDGIYTIVEEENGQMRLKSGRGVVVAP